MKTEFVKIDNVNGEITVTIEAADYAEKVKKQLKEINKTHPEPGFRPGKVPASLIERKYGKSVKYDVINKEVGNALFEYIKEQKLHVLGNPMPDAQNDFNIDQEGFTLKFKVGLAPEFDTHVNKDLHIPYYNIEVTDDMIARQDEMFRKRFGKQEPGDTVEPNALVKGVITELNADGSKKEDGIVVENGIVSPEYFKSEDQKALFVGKHVGDKVVFNPAATCNGSEAELASMLNIAKEEAGEHHGDFEMEIKEIIVLKPAELNQDFYNAIFGPDKVKNEEEYRKAIHDMIADSLRNDQNYRFTIDAKKAIQDAIGTLELPDEVLKNFLKEQNEALDNENIDEEYVRLRPELEWELEKEAVASQLDIKVEADDVKAMARSLAAQQLAQYGMTNATNDILDMYAENILKDQKAYQQVYGQTVDMKLYNGIRASVTLDEKTVNVEQFNDLFRNELAEKAE